jgi:hypothetical protein
MAIFDDQVVSVCKPNCIGTTKTLRTWTILDWCVGRNVTCTQIIKKLDKVAPEIESIAAYPRYSVDAWACDVDITMPAAVVKDNCDPDATIVAVEGPVGVQVVKRGSAWVALAVPSSPKEGWTFTYTASDCCGNTSTESIQVVVEDRVAPVATAKEFITVSLTRSGDATTTGVAKIFTHQVDNGSYDNCSKKVYMEIRRADGAPACLNEGDRWDSNGSGSITSADGLWNNNVTYNDETNGLDQAVPLHGPFDNTADTDKGQFVKFCCDDIGKEVKVWLRVWDDANGSGVYGDEITNEDGVVCRDNFNETWANVKVEDKIVPKIFCPPSITIDCSRDTGVVAVYNFVSSLSAGTWVTATATNTPANYLPTAEGVCGNYEFEFKDIGSLGTCNTGSFVRTYRIKGNPVLNTVTCTTNITVGNIDQSPVLEWPIDLHVWNQCTLSEADVYANTVRANTPADVYAGCGTSGTNLPAVNSNNSARTTNGLTPDAAPLESGLRGKARFNSNYKEIGCSVFGKKITIEEYTVGDACKKWLVRWDYINWCNNSNAGCRQTLYKYEDTTAPVITSAPGLNTDVIDGSCVINHTFRPSAIDTFCDGQQLTWRARVYPFTKVIPVNPTGDFLNPTSSSVLSGNNPSIVFNGLPAGEHGIRYFVTDGCGNVSERDSVIGIWPKAATPYCVSLSSAVMKNGLVELWADDFDKGSFTNCNNGVMLFTFNRNGIAEHPVPSLLKSEHYFTGFGVPVPGTLDQQKAQYDLGRAQLWKPEVSIRQRPNLLNGSAQSPDTTLLGGTSALQFGCKTSSPNPVGTPFNVEMRVWDARSFKAGTTQGSDFCRVTLTLVDNQSACTPAGLAVNGSIATSKGDGITGVETKLMANMPEFPVVSNTQNGIFSFANIPAGVEFELSARKNDDHINGVNTLDLVTIQRHILGIAKLNSAYKYVAADADNNQKINLSDLVELRKLVLGISNEILNNTSWRFVDAKQKFADISNPWPLDEVIVTTASAKANNFVAVKVGDVNIDAAVNATSANLTSRSASAMKLIVDQATLTAGEVVSIPVRASNFNEAYGFQMTTELKGLELVSVQSGAITVEEGMVATPKAGVMTMSWTAANGATVSDDAVLFTINVRAKSTVDVSRAIAITSSVTEAVAFVGSDLNASNVELEVRGAGVSAFALGQNEPNPFKAETNIKFTMPEAGEAKFRVVDVTGRVLVNQVISAAKGENVITLKRADLAATGVVYYQIESGDFTATKKMVIIE